MRGGFLWRLNNPALILYPAKIALCLRFLLTHILYRLNILIMATLIVDKISDELKNEFKSQCYKRGLNMRDVIIRLMEMELDERVSVILKPQEKKKV